MNRKEVLQQAEMLLDMFSEDNTSFWENFQKNILERKIQFSNLEHLANYWYANLERKHVLNICEKTYDLGFEGGYVIVAQLLRNLSTDDMSAGLDLATRYISSGEKWYICDITAERVFGNGLLNDFDTTMPYLTKFVTNTNNWLQRTVGIAIHFAVKKGLDRKYLPEIFELLLPQFESKQLHVKKGSGRALKTITRFHPDFVQSKSEILEGENINNWHKKKVKEGLRTQK